jgi:hypothetical protein
MRSGILVPSAGSSRAEARQANSRATALMATKTTQDTEQGLLGVYLNDHLAGATVGLELVRRMAAPAEPGSESAAILKGWFQARPVPAARGGGQAVGSAGSGGAVRQMA